LVNFAFKFNLRHYNLDGGETPGSSLLTQYGGNTPARFTPVGRCMLNL
jgi:hypothetical protein